MAQVSGEFRATMSREDLLAEFRKVEVECQEEYEKAVKAWRLKRNQWAKKAVLQIREGRKELEKIEREVKESPERYLYKLDKNGGRVDPKERLDSRHGGEFPVGNIISGSLRIEQPPSPPTKPKGAGRLIQMVQRSSQDSWRVSESQWRAWMEQCRL